MRAGKLTSIIFIRDMKKGATEQFEIGIHEKNHFKSVIVPPKQTKQVKAIKKKTRFKSLKLEKINQKEKPDLKRNQADMLAVDPPAQVSNKSYSHNLGTAKPKIVRKITQRRSNIKVTCPTSKTILKSVIFKVSKRL